MARALNKVCFSSVLTEYRVLPGYYRAIADARKRGFGKEARQWSFTRLSSYGNLRTVNAQSRARVIGGRPIVVVLRSLARVRARITVVRTENFHLRHSTRSVGRHSTRARFERTKLSSFTLRVTLIRVRVEYALSRLTPARPETGEYSCC